jgi:cytochrome c553
MTGKCFMMACHAWRALGFVLVVVGTISGEGAASAASGDVEAGRERARTCRVCHGPEGISARPGVPSLAGNGDQFLQWQMVFYRAGRRVNVTMQALSADLTDVEIRNLGAYFASLPADAASPVAEPDAAAVARGQTIAVERHCSACHGDAFTGAGAAPRLARQRPEYLAKALHDFRSGARPSLGLAAMTEAAAGLDDGDIAALTQFLATIPQQSAP